MFADRKRLIFVLLLASCVLAPFIFFSLPLKTWETQNPAIMFWQKIIYPFEYTWHQTSSTSSNLYKTYIDLSDTAKDNAKLKDELTKIRTKIIDYEEQVQENARLRKLLGFAGHYEKQMHVGEVIGTINNLPFQSFRISIGDNPNIRIGMPVIAADGVVGRIIRTGGSFADVQLLIDSNFNLDVMLQRTRVRGILTGNPRGHSKLQLHKRSEIRIGDTLVTAGIVGGFPKGLPVGRVVRISYDSDNVSQVVSIDPWVDFRRIEEVMIIYHPDHDLQKIIETAGPDWIDKTIRNASGG